MRKKNPPQVCGLIWCCKFSLAQGKRGRNTKLTKETLATPMCISTNNAKKNKNNTKKTKTSKINKQSWKEKNSRSFYDCFLKPKFKQCLCFFNWRLLFRNPNLSYDLENKM